MAQFAPHGADCFALHYRHIAHRLYSFFVDPARMSDSVYIAIDLKSFYASVECLERQLNPLTTHLVVADATRTQKTICLAVTPSLKAYGLSSRSRLFEVTQKIATVNRERARRSGAPTGTSHDAPTLQADPHLAVDFIVAPPQMALYLNTSARIYRIYLRHIAAQDIHVYSIDEVFIDATSYLALYKTSARDLAMRLIREVFEATGITATAGIGPNLYLAKIAMDMVAKTMPPDANGVRLASLDVRQYRRLLWTHRPLQDFWRVGPGLQSRLHALGLFTMGDVARASLSEQGETGLFRALGVQAELLIDHAWGLEPVRIADIKAYRPAHHSLSAGQVLQCPYVCAQARLVTLEMAAALALDLSAQHSLTDQVTLTIGYDMSSLTPCPGRPQYLGPTEQDAYGRNVPKAAHGSTRLPSATASSRLLHNAFAALFDRIAHPGLLVRRLTLAVNHVQAASQAPAAVPEKSPSTQLDLFAPTDSAVPEQGQDRQKRDLEREQMRQKTIVLLQRRFGKNCLIKGINLLPGATACQRNKQIGGHRA